MLTRNINRMNSDAVNRTRRAGRLPEGAAFMGVDFQADVTPMSMLGRELPTRLTTTINGHVAPHQTESGQVQAFEKRISGLCSSAISK